MSDAVELMEFWPVDADENIGFVAADSDFQLWLLDGIGISFDDISYSVIDGPDNSGIYELVLDYEDYTTLNELYASYLGDNEYASEEGQSPIMDPMDFGEPVNWTPLDGTPSLKRRKDAEGSGEINIGPVYVEKKVPVLFKHDHATKDYEWSTDEPSYLTDDQEYELVEIVEQIVEDSDEEEGDESFDEDDYKGDVTWNTYTDEGRFYDLAAEGANPSGGATGDQIISWEHNGLSSPSGPPSDIFWSEGDYGEYVQIFDTTITKNGIEKKLQRAGIKPIDVFSVYEDGTKSKDIFGVYLKEGDATAFSKEFNKNDWTGLFEFDGAVSFAAQMGHSRFQQSDNPRREISSTRRKLKQEMFSDVSGVVNVKNMAILGITGFIGYWLVRK